MTMVHKLKCVIVDLDGTLCNCDHRKYVVDEGDKEKSETWEKFHSLCSQDGLYMDVWYLVKAMEQMGVEIVFITGRTHDHLDKTMKWLGTHDIRANENDNWKNRLFMRHPDDRSGIAQYKKTVYERNLKNTHEVLFVLDDNEKVVKMFREELGIPCYQVR